MKQILNRKCVAVATVLGLAAAATPVTARDPFTPEELARQDALRLQFVEQGYALWHGSNPNMSSDGLSCGNCHPDTAATNPQTFPKYVATLRRVVQFGEMVNWCIQNPQLGKPLDLASPEMTAIYAYAMALHSGEPIQPGLASEQTKPIPVQYGKGFPSKPTGIGNDTK